MESQTKARTTKKPKVNNCFLCCFKTGKQAIARSKTSPSKAALEIVAQILTIQRAVTKKESRFSLIQKEKESCFLKGKKYKIKGKNNTKK